MNSSKTSRTTKAMHLFHLEQKLSLKNQQIIPSLRENVPTLLKPYALSPTKQSFTLQKQQQQNGYRKLSIEKKIIQLRKEIMNSKSIKPKQLFQTQKLQIKEGFYVIDVKSDHKSIRTIDNKQDKKFKIFQIPIAIQDKISKQSNSQEKQLLPIPHLKFREKQSFGIDDAYNQTPKCLTSTKQPSEPNSPYFIRKLQSQQITQRSISQGYIDKQKQNEWIAWPQNLEGWNTHTNNLEEDLLLQFPYQ